MTLRLREPVFTKFVEYDNLVSIDTSGNATLAITGSALGKTTLDIYSPGQRLIASLGVNVLAPLDVQSIIPAAGRAGTQVVISGSGFRPPCEVKFGNTSAVIYATSDTKLFVTTPAHASGIVEVPVTCSNQTRLLQFTFLGSRTRSAHH